MSWDAQPSCAFCEIELTSENAEKGKSDIMCNKCLDREVNFFHGKYDITDEHNGYLTLYRF